MNSKKIFALFFVLASFSFEAWAGPLVWGPKKYVRETGKPYVVIDSFAIEKPKGKYWLRVDNGEGVQKPGADVGVVEMKNMVSSAIIWVNGEKVVTPNDFNQKVYVIRKDITLQASNTIEVEVRGIPKSFITVEIRKAELNVGVENAKGDLSGENMKDYIVLWWSQEKNAEEYVFYVAYSKDGPWAVWQRSPAVRPHNTVYLTSEATVMDLCFKIEAFDKTGNIIRVYEPICVPKWQVEESPLPLSQEVLPDEFSHFLSKGDEINPFFKQGRLDLSPLPSFHLAASSLVSTLSDATYLALNASTQSSTQSSLPPYDTINKMCLSDDEFIDTTTMDYEDIKKFLKDKGSFLNCLL